MTYSTVRTGTTPIIVAANQFISITASTTAIGTIAIPSHAILQAVSGTATYIYGGYGTDTEVVLQLTQGRFTVLVQDADPTGSGGVVPFSHPLLTNVNATGTTADPAGVYPGGYSNLTATGVFNDTVLSVQYTIDAGAHWTSAGDMAAPGGVYINSIPTGATVRTVVSFIPGGSVNPSGLSLTMSR